MKKNLVLIEFQIDKLNIPIKVYFENRKNSRVSIGKDTIHLRLPKYLKANEVKNNIDWAKDWLVNHYEKKPTALQKFEVKQYSNGDIIRVGSREYILKIEKLNKKNHSGSLHGNCIQLSLSIQPNESNLQKDINTLLSRIIAKDFLPEIKHRVHQLNEQHYKQQVNGVKLRYSHSKWGSCSSSGNLNLSTRLLFAPPKVIDYVIIHELAHLIQPNHSPSFWKLVSEAMPDYQQQEQWLKQHGSQCDFNAKSIYS